jgi:hypothetical protein
MSEVSSSLSDAGSHGAPSPDSHASRLKFSIYNILRPGFGTVGFEIGGGIVGINRERKSVGGRVDEL